MRICYLRSGGRGKSGKVRDRRSCGGVRPAADRPGPKAGRTRFTGQRRWDGAGALNSAQAPC